MSSRIVVESIAASNHVGSSLPPSNSRIDRKLYSAAVEGNFHEFINIQNLESLLTPNKNTILHIHLTSTISETTQHASPTFIQQILRKFRHFLFEIPETIQTPVSLSKEFVIKILDQCGGLVLLPNAKGETLLHMAARYGHSDIARLLIDRVKDFPPDIENGITIGAQIKFIRATNNDKDTALHEAVRYDHNEVVKTLIEIDPACSYYANNANQTPLFMASQRQNQQVAAEILKKVQLPAYGGPNNQTALHAAVINQDAEMARDLLMNEHVRVAVKQADKVGWIPLHYAVERGNRYLTELLLKKDENTAYMQDNEGRTALHIAAYSSFWYIVEMIIKYCPDCSELVDNKGRNALHYAVIMGKWIATDRIMLNLSLSNLYNEKDIDGNTPLHHLANTYLVSNRLVFHRRVDRLAVNKKDQTALDVAYGNSIASKQAIIAGLTRAGAKRSLPLGQKSRNGPELSDLLMITKELKDSHLLVATLIATLTFAAGITLPGGTIQDGEHKGSPILGHRASFKAFIVSNTLAMVMAASAAFIHLFSSRKKAKWKEYNLSDTAFSLTLIAVASMVVAFATATYAVLGSSSVGIAVIIIGLSFFLVFRKVLKLTFRTRSLIAFIAHLLNAILFLFLKFTSTPFGFFFLLLQRSDRAQRIIRDEQMDVDPNASGGNFPEDIINQFF